MEEERKSIDFKTTDPELSCRILEEFPGVIKPHQYVEKKVDGIWLYLFKDIDPQEMTKFFDKINYKPKQVRN